MIVFGEKQKNTIKAPFDYTLEVNEGTPRSGKTTCGVFRYAYYLTITPDENHLVVAYNQEQAYRLIVESDGFGLKHIFGDLCQTKHDDNGDHLLIHTPKGIKKVYYKGGGKADSHKAITGMSLGSVVFCEINLLHMDMIQECFRRTFAARMRYHLADLNPPAPNHPVIKDVFEVQKTRWQHWTIHDNPILTEERKQEIYDTLKKNPYLLERDWYGKRVIPTGVIYSMFNNNKHILSSFKGKPIEMYFSGDGGQDDATSISCNIVTSYEGKFYLHRVANYYHSGADTGQVKAMSDYAVDIKEFIEWCVDRFGMSYRYVFTDPACKSLREELKKLKINAVNADNNRRDAKGGKGSGIEVGIERGQNLLSGGQFFLLETDKYDHYNFIKEIGMYCRDDNGNPIDDYNHALDEFRYSVNYFYTRYNLAERTYNSR